MYHCKVTKWLAQINVGLKATSFCSPAPKWTKESWKSIITMDGFSGLVPSSTSIWWLCPHLNTKSDDGTTIASGAGIASDQTHFIVTQNYLQSQRGIILSCDNERNMCTTGNCGSYHVTVSTCGRGQRSRTVVHLLLLYPWIWTGCQASCGELN